MASAASAGAACSISFKKERASLGVEQHFQAEISELTPFADADLIVASDGVNSKTRTQHAEIFQPDIAVGKCRFIWLGTRQKFAAFTFAFEKTEHGWFQIHAYQFSDEVSTVIVETREETWRAHGLDRYDTEQSIAFCESLFARYLGGHPLMSNANHLRGSAWLNFNRVLCAQWHHGNIVLIGDAAHTAHFGIGSGTKLAMEDAMSLVARVAKAADVHGGAAQLPGGTQPRGSQAAERGAQSNGMVRECGALFEPGAAPIRVCAAHGQPAHRPREPQAARCTASWSSTSAGWQSAAACRMRCGRRCFCRSSSRA